MEVRRVCMEGERTYRERIKCVRIIVKVLKK